MASAFLGDWTGSHLGWDFWHYVAGSQRWLDTGSPYAPEWLAGPIARDDMAFMHPPVAVLLFLPFIWLPALLWWILPLSWIAWCFWGWKPGPLTLAAVFVLWAYPEAIQLFFLGNSAIWLAAFVALGLRFGWPFALLIIKPTLIPLAVFGVHKRSTWIAGFMALGVCALFGALWLDWWKVVGNWQGPADYTLLQVRLALAPVVVYAAWWLRGNRSRVFGGVGIPRGTQGDHESGRCIERNRV